MPPGWVAGPKRRRAAEFSFSLPQTEALFPTDGKLSYDGNPSRPAKEVSVPTWQSTECRTCLQDPRCTSPGPGELSELARDVALPISTTSRLLATLEEVGGRRALDNVNLYRIGPASSQWPAVSTPPVAWPPWPPGTPDPCRRSQRGGWAVDHIGLFHPLHRRGSARDHRAASGLGRHPACRCTWCPPGLSPWRPGPTMR